MGKTACGLRLAACGFLAAACAHAPPRQKIELDPIVITAGKEAPVVKSAEQLFDDGGVYFRAGHFAKSAEQFDNLITEFPGSPQTLPALYNAGLAHERLDHWQEALDRFTAVIGRDPQGKDELDAQLHAATAEYRLGKKLQAALRLHAVAERPGLPAQRKGEALEQEAVCRVELGARSEGERLLREALQSFGDDAAPELLGKAEFWLGEIYRGYFLESPLDPATMDEKKLEDAMEAKAQFLLSAQGHYLRAIRRGEGEWATAAGFRIGELYESFHDALLNAPLPKGLDQEQIAEYRRQLRERVRVLIGKSIRIYEQTLDTAQRTSASSEYVAKARAALERVRRLLVSDQPTL